MQTNEKYSHNSAADLVTDHIFCGYYYLPIERKVNMCNHYATLRVGRGCWQRKHNRAGGVRL